jgi:putative sterol carrier protein
MNLSDMFYGMKEYFQPEWAGKIKADVEFRVSGKEAAVFVMSFNMGSLDIREGIADKPDVIVSCDTEVMRNILLGNTSSLGAYMDDKIRVEGDMTIGMAITQVFRPGPERFRGTAEVKPSLLEIVK